MPSSLRQADIALARKKQAGYSSGNKKSQPPQQRKIAVLDPDAEIRAQAGGDISCSFAQQDVFLNFTLSRKK
jgi:hypothetical protein